MIRFTVLLSFILSSSAFALPLHQDITLKESPALAAVGNQYDFEGIIALNNCSGSLIKFTHSVPTDKAVVLTNGHCLADAFGGGMPKPGKVIVNENANRKITILNPADGEGLGTVKATKIIYASMTRTDVTFYELNKTYAEIEQSFQIKALVLSDKQASVGEGMDIISGYWKRGYSCKIEAIVPTLKEAGWTMNDSIRYSRPGCEIIGGTSGSPIISQASGEVIGINNTMNEKGEKCTMNNPCEVDAQGTTTHVKGYGYGQQTFWFYTCLNASKQLDLNTPGCLLAK